MQLVTSTTWSSLGPAVVLVDGAIRRGRRDPGCHNSLLGSVGVEGGREFGTYASSVDFEGVRYVLVETEEGTDLIIREAN